MTRDQEMFAGEPPLVVAEHMTAMARGVLAGNLAVGFRRPAALIGLASLPSLLAVGERTFPAVQGMWLTAGLNRAVAKRDQTALTFSDTVLHAFGQVE